MPGPVMWTSEWPVRSSRRGARVSSRRLLPGGRAGRRSRRRQAREVEVLELARGSSRRRRRRRSWERACRPSGARPRPSALHDVSIRSGRGVALGLALGRNLGERARVGVGADRDPAVGLLGRPLRQRRDPLELSVGGAREVGRLLALERHRHDRVAARRQDVARRPLRSAARRRRFPRSRRCRPPSPWSSSRRGSWPGCDARIVIAALPSVRSTQPVAGSRWPSP